MNILEPCDFGQVELLSFVRARCCPLAREQLRGERHRVDLCSAGQGPSRDGEAAAPGPVARWAVPYAWFQTRGAGQGFPKGSGKGKWGGVRENRSLCQRQIAFPATASVGG